MSLVLELSGWRSSECDYLDWCQ